MTSAYLPLRRWFRFSLRTFFVLLTLFCVWLGVQVKWKRNRHEAVNWVEQSGGEVTLASAMPQGSRDWLQPPLPWGLRVLRATPIRDIDTRKIKFRNADERHARMRELRALFPESKVLDS